ncbi:MAG: hypothetical protein AMJ78_07955 [Omnitrophica WOR_2 bacterium SM23_29]|nr:MAG: hypothetical protein AMJ78_07955 [Omnitrophica WOR_2 bacterium SM23_29]
MARRGRKVELKGAIFDLDGVVVDTVPLHFKAWKKMFSEYGREFTFEDYKKKVDGIPRMDGARAILNDLSDEELEKAAAKKQKYFLDFLLEEGVRVYKGTLDLISQLRNKNIKIAVISSSKNCLDILERAEIVNIFDVIITGNDIKRGKPNPDIFLMACARLQLEPSGCIVFEDAYMGVKAAKEGNFKCIGVDRYQDPQRLSGADLVVSDLSEIDYKKMMELLQR